MNDRRPNRMVRCAIILAAAAAFALPASAQTQDVQSRVVPHPAAVARTDVAPLAEWETGYATALEAARQLQSSSQTRELGEQLELDLQAYSEALEAYVRVSERLRHKDRALTATMEELNNSGQADPRLLQTLSNAQKTAHDTAKNAISNIR